MPSIGFASFILSTLVAELPRSDAYAGRHDHHTLRGALRSKALESLRRRFARIITSPTTAAEVDLTWVAAATDPRSKMLLSDEDNNCVREVLLQRMGDCRTESPRLVLQLLDSDGEGLKDVAIVLDDERVALRMAQVAEQEDMNFAAEYHHAMWGTDVPQVNRRRDTTQDFRQLMPLEAELSAYIMAPLSVTAHNPYAWWCEMAPKFPTVAALAIKFLSGT